MNFSGSLSDYANYKSSAWALVAANALPIVGVLFFGWDTFAIVFLYWIENVIIGAINVLKMIVCTPDSNSLELIRSKPDEDARRAWGQAQRDRLTDSAQLLNQGAKFFLVPFFVFHYGLFCLVHGIFIFVLFGREAGGARPFDLIETVPRLLSAEHLWLGVLALAASHLWSFVVNYLGRGEYQHTIVPALMIQPYARVIVLHLAILLGAFIAFAVGSGIAVLIILIIGKTLLDLHFHLRERERSLRTVGQETSVLPEVITNVAPEPATWEAKARSHRPGHSSSGDGS